MAALSRASTKWAAAEGAKEQARQRRDKQVADATARADERMRAALEELEEKQDELLREVLALEGASTKEIATALGVPSRRVNAARGTSATGSPSRAEAVASDQAGEQVGAVA